MTFVVTRLLLTAPHHSCPLAVAHDLGQSEDVGQHCGKESMGPDSVVTEKQRRASVANAMEPTLWRNVAFLQQLNMQLRSICSILVSISRRQML